MGWQAKTAGSVARTVLAGLALATLAGGCLRTPAPSAPAVDPLERARAALAQGHAAEALAVLQSRTGVDPENARLRYYQALAYAESGRAAQASAELTAALRQHAKLTATDRRALTAEELPQAYQRKAAFDLAEGKLDAAVESATRALTFQANDASTLVLRAKVFERKGLHQAALIDLDQALHHDPRHTEAYRLRSRLLLASGNPDSALDDAHQALRLEPTTVANYLAAASATLRLSTPDHAYAVLTLREAARLGGNSAEIQQELARAHLEWAKKLRSQGDVVAAEAKLAEAVKIDGKYAAEYAAHAEVFDRSQGIRQRITAMLVKPNDKALELYGKGQAALGEKKYEEAIVTFTEAIDAAPRYLDPYLSRAEAFLARRMADSAMADLDRALELAPDHPPAYVARAKARLATSEWAMAIRDTTEALRKQPGYVEAMLVRANAYAKCARYDLALADLDEVKRVSLVPAETDPLQAEVYLGLGRAAIAERNWQLGVESLSKACDIDAATREIAQSETANAFAQYGERLAADGYQIEAIGLYGDAIRYAPRNSWYYQLRGLAYYRMGRWRSSYLDLSHALELDPLCEAQVAAHLRQLELNMGQQANASR